MSNQMLYKEYFPIKKYKQGSDNDISPFDIIADLNRCSEYKKEGIYCNGCFNQELINKLESFSSLERIEFINYQINLYGDPLDYLTRLRAFLNDNENNFRSSGNSTVSEFKYIAEQGIKQFSQNQNGSKKPQANNNEEFISEFRISELEGISTSAFDMSRLISMCNEINLAYKFGSYISLIMLTRALIDHIPPIFGQENFNNVYGQYGNKSFKDSMKHLDASMRKIADSYLHTHIRKRESLPTSTQVNFSQDLDVLLAEIIRKENE